MKFPQVFGGWESQGPSNWYQFTFNPGSSLETTTQSPLTGMLHNFSHYKTNAVRFLLSSLGLLLNSLRLLLSSLSSHGILQTTKYLNFMKLLV